MRRRVRGGIAGLLAAAATLGFGACTGGDDSSGAGTELTWFVAVQRGGSFEASAAKCSEESDGRYSIKVELLPLQADAQREQLVRRLGAEDSSIDIIGMDVIWTAEFANAGWVREWTGPLAEEATRNRFESSIETASFEGTLYGAPYNANPELLFYRKDLVPEPPATWAEMIEQAKELDSSIALQANRYEGLVVWFNSLLQSAGTEVLSGPTEVDLAQEPTEEALSVMGAVARDAPASGFETSNESTAASSFESGESAFQINYTFAPASAEANAPDVFKNMGIAPYPAVVEGEPARPPLGGFNLGVSSFSENADLAFEAAACIAGPEDQITVAELDGLPPSAESIYTNPKVEKAFDGFAPLVKEALDNSAPRPLTPAYTDLSLAIQRALHPPGKIDPADPTPVYEDLREKVEQAVKREGLL